MAVINPLTKTHCDGLDCVLNSYQDIKDTIGACEECGLDLSSQKEALEAQKEFASTVKRKFNPLAP